jgi:ferredoxin
MRIVVDPIACEAHGLCAELLPEAIVLDDWGYPVIAAGELPESLERLARRAVSACPTLALRLVARRAGARAPGSPSSAESKR